MKKFCFILVAAWVAWGCGPRGNTLNKELSNFKVEDTAAIDKIFLADMQNNTILLQRDGSQWRVNNDFMARPDMIKNLLNTIRRVEVKQYVPKPAVENIIKSLAVTGTKVEIYQHGKLLKTYYVGGPTQDHYGTYMLLEGSDIPFVCYIPGFRGYLTNHYIPLIDEWRDRKIFAYDISEIGSVKVEFFNDPASSWEIKNLDNAHFTLKALQSGQNIERFDTSRVKDVLQNFKVMGFEGFVNVNAARMDSVKAKYGLYRVSLTEKDGGVKFVDLYSIPLQPGTLDMLGRPVTTDVDRMYGIVDGKNVTICQFYTFDPVTIPISEFMPADLRRKQK
jgi:hypothetical protein